MVAVFGLVLQSRLLFVILTAVFIWSACGVAWDLLSGYTGPKSFGNAAFLGLGATTSVSLLNFLGMTPYVGMFLAGLVSSLAAVLIGITTFRLHGFYFSMASITYPLILGVVVQYFLSTTLGRTEMAINFVGDNPWLMQFSSPEPYFLIALAALLIVIVVAEIIVNSKLGLAIRSIRDGDEVAEALGIDTFRYKMVIRVITAFITGVLGSLQAHALLWSVAPSEIFSSVVSAQLVLIPVLGGMGTIYGSVLGSLIVILSRELLIEVFGPILVRGEGGLYLILQGVLLMIVIVKLPRGVYPHFREAVDWLVSQISRRNHSAKLRRIVHLAL